MIINPEETNPTLSNLELSNNSFLSFKQASQAILSTPIVSISWHHMGQVGNKIDIYSSSIRNKLDRTGEKIDIQLLDFKNGLDNMGNNLDIKQHIDLFKHEAGQVGNTIDAFTQNVSDKLQVTGLVAAPGLALFPILFKTATKTNLDTVVMDPILFVAGIFGAFGLSLIRDCILSNSNPWNTKS